MHFSSFEDAALWMDSFIPPSSSAPGLLRSARLERMRKLLRFLGSPEESFKAVHVAGSKGKGSTARFISAAMTAAGLKTGLYLSPHLVDYRERFTLDGAFFPDSLLIRTADELASRLEHFTFSGEVYDRPSTFELYTAYAYLLFRNAGCTHAVIETGLGGRLDATNTIESMCEVITPIELEHTAVLGDTIEKIAVEKSKIIKKNSLCFTSVLYPQAMQVMQEEADRMSAQLIRLDRELVRLETETRAEGEVCTIAFRDGYEARLCLKMRGEVQALNAALALLCTRRMGLYRERLSERAVENAVLPGRFELTSWHGIPVVLDVCHTPVSTAHTAASFASLYPDRNRTCIFAAIEGKDIEHMLRKILPCFSTLIVSRPSSAKKSNSDAVYRLALELNGKGCRIVHIPDSRKALEEAERTGGPVLIAGSFYLTSLFKELIDAELK